MSDAKFRANVNTILFNAFSVISVFFLLNPFIKKATDTITINGNRIHFDQGWLTTYLFTLLITFFLAILLKDKRQIWLTTIGVLLGSLPLLEQYNFPVTAKLGKTLGQQGGANIEIYIPYLAIIVGILIVFGLIKGANKVFK